MSNVKAMTRSYPVFLLALVFACGDSTVGSNTEDASMMDASMNNANQTACVTFCQCLEPTCAAEPAYPFADVSECEENCKQLTQAEFDCFTHWCDEARKEPLAGQKFHLCQHAWGIFDLDECP